MIFFFKNKKTLVMSSPKFLLNIQETNTDYSIDTFQSSMYTVKLCLSPPK